MSVLDILGHKNGTDKASGAHDYLHFYERFLAPMRDREVKVLEMGVASGGSVRMWRDYFAAGRVVGFDLQDCSEHASDRIAIVQGDQSNEGQLQAVLNEHGPFDLIIDDAGHEPDYQMFAYLKLLPTLRPGGLYILEDIMTDAVVSMLNAVSRDIVLGRAPHHDALEFVAFYRETSVTKRRG